MKNIDKDLDLLERYQEGELTSEEQAAVEQRLKSDPEFIKLYQVSQEAVQAIREFGKDRTRELLQRIHQEESGRAAPPKVKSLFRRRILPLAATLAFLIIATIWLINQPPSPEATFQSFYTTPVFDQVRNGSVSDPLLVRAETSYRAGDFSEALSLFNQYRESHPTSGRILYFIGICQIETEQYKAAEFTFRELAGLADFNDEAAWYLSLVYIRLDRYPEAAAELNKIINGEVRATAARREQAGALLHRID